MEKKQKAIMLGLINPEGYELDNRVYFRGVSRLHKESAMQNLRLLKSGKESKRSRSDG